MTAVSTTLGGFTAVYRIGHPDPGTPPDSQSEVPSKPLSPLPTLPPAAAWAESDTCTP